MEQRRLGDREVGAIGLGGASWSIAETRDDKQSEALIRFALENGVTYIDSAAAYTTADEASHNERLVSRAVRASGLDALIATKGGHRRAGDHWYIDGLPSAIRADCDESLAALGVDAIDLYYLHKPDPHVPFADSVSAIEQLRVEGKVRMTGVSNVSGEQFREALSLTPLAAVQNNFSPFNTSDRALIDECQRHSVAYVVYSPLGGSNRPRTLDAAMPRAATAAASLGVSLERLIIAWELSLAASVIPVVGASRPATLLDSIRATEVDLDDRTREALETP